jgi:ribosome-binding protein aMBF1 (putative translation factor)
MIMGLKELRRKYDLTQKQLADRLGWKKSRIASIETLQTDMKEAWAVDLAKFFKMTLSEFMDEYKNGWQED